MGATTNRQATRQSRSSFNPRPSRRMGATDAGEERQRRVLVSILAHPEGWALPPFNRQGERCGYMFQSSPIPKDGRYSLAMFALRLVWRFNPRPSRRMGATGDHRNCRGVACFNPRPSRRMGATSCSMHAAFSHECFNPRPSRRMGATSIGALPLVRTQVSILAHPEGWALRNSERRYSCRSVCFNPRPSRRMGATSAGTHIASSTMFQSSPIPKDGRYLGDHYEHVVNVVSILAHPEGWALPKL